MSELPRQFQPVKAVYLSARYPGDLAADVLPRASHRARWNLRWLRPLFAGAAAAAVVTFVLIRVDHPTPAAAAQSVAVLKDSFESLKQVAQSTGLFSTPSSHDAASPFRIVPDTRPLEWPVPPPGFAPVNGNPPAPAAPATQESA